jgi:ABC-type transport system involved in Fe-S cluster assembly fused permease/ATPase subunit
LCRAATDEEFGRIVEKCQLEPIIARFPEGLKTRVGERGARLSGGERQKVAIARYVANNVLTFCLSSA